MLKFAETGVQAFAEMDRAISVKEQLKSMEAEFERSRVEMLKFAETGVQAFNDLKTGAEKVKVAEKEVAPKQTSAQKAPAKKSPAKKSSAKKTSTKKK
jgi:hypothetical protein